jgi:cation transport ATPase
MSDKKKFKETTIGKLLFGAASMINPALGSVLNGVSTPQEALAAIGKSKISNDDKIKLQQMIYDQQNKEMEAVTARWESDQKSDSWMAKNVRPMVLIWCIVVFSLAGILDSIDNVPFTIGVTWNDTFEKVMMAVVLAYFGGRSSEKAIDIFKKNG